MTKKHSFVQTEKGPIVCPRCGNLSLVRVIYGFPSGELFEQADKGNVVLSGCIEELGFSEEQIDMVCNKCKLEVSLVPTKW